MPEPENISMPVTTGTEELPAGDEGDVKLFGGEILEDESPTKTEEVETESESEVESKEETKEEVTEEPEAGGRTRPTIKDITNKFPDFFKQFPELRHAFFREQEFSQIFGDIEEAKEAAEQAKDYQFFEDKVVNGDAKTFLETVKDNGKENLEAFANAFLPALHEVDNGTFLQATAPFVQNLLESAYRAGNDAGNNDLKYSAAHLAKWIFGDTKYATGEARIPQYKKAEKPVDKDREEFEKERSDFHKSRYESAHNDVNDMAIGSVKEMISENLDPNDDLTEFVKDHIIDDTWKQVDRLLANDKDHIKYMNRLWENAKNRGFDRGSTSRIVKAYVDRARELIPEVRKQVKAKALGRRVTTLKDSDKGHTEVTGESRGGGNRRRPTDAKEVDWNKTSDEDLFSGKVTYKQR